MSNKVKLVHMQTSNQFIMTVPKVLVEAMGWKKGDELEVIIPEMYRGLLVRKVKE